MTADRDPEVRAAGGVLWRSGDGGSVEVAVVHRPRYDDWSLPKGKLDPGEDWEDAALREVEEETGVRGTLGSELPSITYHDNKGRFKLVRYWLMEASGDLPDFEPNDETDELRWLGLSAATELMTYRRDRDVLASAGMELGV